MGADRTDNIRIQMYINNAQAQAALDSLQKEYRKLRTEQKKFEAGTEDWLKKQREIDGVTAKMVDFRKSADLSTMSIKQLTNHAKLLRNIRDNLIPGTKEFSEMSAEIKKVETRLSNLKDGLTPLQRFWKGISADTKAMVAGAATMLGIQALLGKIQNMVSSRSELEDKFADVSKTTNMSIVEVEKLDKELRKINTRTARKELLDLARDAGKLGYEGVADVKKFVEESNMISVALKEDLGEEAVTQISKSSKIYKEGLLNIASGINEIGASSEASEQYTVDFLYRLSGVAPTAKITAGEIMGFSAALEINGQTAEKSSTALNDFFISFVKNADSFGETAGFARGELKKLLEEKGTNEAFIQFLSKLKEGAKSSEDMLRKLEQLGIDGTRGANVFLTLANNVNLVRQQQEVANKSIKEGTSVIAEYDKKNNNMAANLEKVQKRIAQWFTSNGISDWIKDTINGLSYSLMPATERLSEQYEQQKRKVEVLEKSYVPLIDQYEKLSSKTNLSVKESFDLNDIIKKLAETFPGAITEVDKYGKALGISAEKARTLIQVEKEMLRIKNKETLAKHYEESTRVYAEYLKAQQDIVMQQKLFDQAERNRAKYPTLKTTDGKEASWSTMFNQINSKMADAQERVRKYRLEWEATQNVMRELQGEAPLFAPSTNPTMDPGNNMPTVGGTDPTEEELKKLEEARKEKERIAAEEKKEFERIQRESLDSYEKTIKQIIDLRQKQSDDLQSKEDQELIAIQDKWQAVIDATQKAIEEQTKAYKTGDITALDRAQELGILLTEVYDGIQEDITAKLKEQLKAREDAEAKAAEERIDKMLEEAELIKQNRAKVRYELSNDYQREYSDITKYYDDMKSLKGLSNEDIMALEEKKWQKIRELQKAAFDQQQQLEMEKFQQIKQTYQMGYSYVSGIIQAFNNHLTNEENTRLNSYLYGLNLQKQKYDEMLSKKQISQKKHDKLVEELDKRAAKRRYDIEVQQFKRNQENQIATVWVNAIAKAVEVAIEHWPYGLIESGLILGLAGAQTAEISSQSPPTFQYYGKGGQFLDQGVSHAHPSGGMPVLDPVTGKTVAKVEVGETIIPVDTTKENWPIISWMLENKGKSFLSNVSGLLPEFSGSSASQVVRMEKGGILDLKDRTRYTSGTTYAQDSSDKITPTDFYKALALIQKTISEKDFVFSLYDLEKQQAIKQSISDLNKLN